MSQPENTSKSKAPTQSRRDFVKTSSALIIGGTALASNLNLARAAHVSGDDEIKICVIGCGGRGTGAVTQALLTEGKVTLWAMADAFGGRLETCLGKVQRQIEKGVKADNPNAKTAKIDVPPERQFVGLDAYQKAIDSGVDLVILTTPPGFRPIQFEAAVEANKHIFTEKPLAVDGPGIRRVLAAGKKAVEKGLAVGVGLQRHHQAPYIETVKRLRDGAIGDIPLMRVYWNGPGLWVRTRTDFEKAYGHKPTEMEYQVNNWYYFNWLCGDHVVEQHIHNLDVSNWIKGAYPTEVNGMGGREVRTDKEHGQIFDHHFLEYSYADGSTTMSQCRHIPGCMNQVGERATGTKGTAHISKHKISGPGGDWEYKGPRVDAYQVEHDDLFAAIRKGEKYNEIVNGAYSTLTAIMGRMASYSGKVITWEKALNSTVDLSPSKYDFSATPPVVPNENGEYPIPVPGKTKVV